jgi:flagellar biosynthesis/type III secretory pathway M-ring protein FliF/YscJ
VRRLVKIGLIVLGIRWFLRWRRRRREQAELAAAPATSSDPAMELKEKLAASRLEEEPDEPAAPEASVEERRAGVHEQGRATVDAMTSSDED